jgi:hypothetical protein
MPYFACGLKWNYIDTFTVRPCGIQTAKNYVTDCAIRKWFDTHEILLPTALRSTFFPRPDCVRVLRRLLRRFSLTNVCPESSESSLRSFHSVIN